MEFKHKIQEFNKRWSITDNSSYEQEFIKFKTRISNILEDIDYNVAEEGIEQFCQVLGIPNRSLSIISALRTERDEKKFYFILELIFSLPIYTRHGFSREVEYSRNILLGKLKNAIELSNINLAITVKSDEIILYPRGEEVLDEELIEDVLSFLSLGAQEHFVEALRHFEKRTPRDARKSAESVRRSVEEFLRQKLGNSKGLDGNISELQARLKKNGRDSFVRNIIFQTFSNLDKYFNKNSKHNDGDIDVAENEFLLYQAGLLMRYINQVLV